MAPKSMQKNFSFAGESYRIPCIPWIPTYRCERKAFFIETTIEMEDSNDEIYFAPVLLEISADGQLVVPVEQLQQAGFVPGDRLVLSQTGPGQLYLHKVDVLPGAADLRETVGRLIREVFQTSGYTTREAVVALGREVRREIARER